MKPIGRLSIACFGLLYALLSGLLPAYTIFPSGESMEFWVVFFGFFAIGLLGYSIGVYSVHSYLRKQ